MEMTRNTLITPILTEYMYNLLIYSLIILVIRLLCFKYLFNFFIVYLMSDAAEFKNKIHSYSYL